MDNLDYTYSNSGIGNRLLKVQDNSNINFGFKDNINQTNDYTYDPNGNMIRDYNKAINTNMTYNHLNLPTHIPINGGSISYYYDAAGVKQKKVVSGGATTEYAGNYVYEHGVLQFASTIEGYLKPVNPNNLAQGFNYVYKYKDHLGNIRLTYADSNNNGNIDPVTEIISEKNYYPFGLQHKGYNSVVSANSSSVAQRFSFGGKEFNDELGLGWYDVSARNYDPTLARWMNIDPLAERMRKHSPYNFGFNNPVYFQDYDGMSPSGPNPIKKLVKKAAKKIAGRLGKQRRLRQVLDDPKASKSDKGWIKSEINQMKKNNELGTKRKSIRNPPGKDLAHERGREAAKGYDYEHSNLQNRADHRRQHKYDNNGRKNKERPVESATVAAASTISNEEASASSADSASFTTGSDSLDFITNASYEMVSFMDNFGTGIFGDNSVGTFVDDWLNPFPGLSELLKPIMEPDGSNNSGSSSSKTNTSSSQSESEECIEECSN